MALIKEYAVQLEAASFSSDYPDSIKRILLARDIGSDAELNASLASMEPPGALKGIDAAVELLEDALQQQRIVLVCGDYDADGATSTALLIRVLKQLGLQQIDFLVPNRFDFGYGLSPELVDVAAANEPKPDLIITVDNGISSVAGVDHARQLGMDVLVTDHHLPGSQLPNANAIVNPNQPDCQFASKHLAGVGVVFYLLIALRARLRESGWFRDQGLSEPRLEQYLDLVALGTIADVVKLDRLNRILVSQGLKLICSGQGNPGIRNLFLVAGRDLRYALSSDLGFSIGPRINAAGRLDDITQGILCLLADDDQQAHEYAQQMHQMNQDRRQIQEHMVAEAERALAELLSLQDTEDDSALPWGYCCFHADWHQGLVGLVASKIKERLHRPVIAFAKAESGELKGSARSIPGLHIRDCLERVSSRYPDLISKFGGHAMAAGLTIQESDYPAFIEAFDEAVRSMLQEQDLQAVVWTDGQLQYDQLSIGFARKIERLLPWGQGVPEPQFSGEFEVHDLRWLKETHLKLKLALKEAPNQSLDAIWFNAPQNVIQQRGDCFQAVYRLGVNRYMEKESLQLQIVKA